VTRPRPVFPGTFPFITRRATQRQFLLRPDEETNNAFVYCMAVAAERSELGIVLPQMMSNHYHLQADDPHGRHTEFREYFHTLLTKCLNAYRGRWENMWAVEEPCVVEVVDRAGLMDKLVYIATNPVKDGLVECVRHWPGPKFVEALLTGKPLRARRPRHFFRKDGNMPETVELELRLPANIEDPEGFLAELRERIAAVEAEHKAARLKTGRRVFGRGRILRQSWRDTPTSQEPRRGLRPRVAARSKWARIATLQRNKEFELAYRDARECWLAGLPAVFPPGTYWLRRFANVVVGGAS
jgi:REP element-mobilizing transposase RayT